MEGLLDHAGRAMQFFRSLRTMWKKAPFDVSLEPHGRDCLGNQARLGEGCLRHVLELTTGDPRASRTGHGRHGYAGESSRAAPAASEPDATPILTSAGVISAAQLAFRGKTQIAFPLSRAEIAMRHAPSRNSAAHPLVAIGSRVPTALLSVLPGDSRAARAGHSLRWLYLALYEYGYENPGICASDRSACWTKAGVWSRGQCPCLGPRRARHKRIGDAGTSEARCTCVIPIRRGGTLVTPSVRMCIVPGVPRPTIQRPTRAKIHAFPPADAFHTKVTDGDHEDRKPRSTRSEMFLSNYSSRKRIWKHPSPGDYRHLNEAGLGGIFRLRDEI
jgi:hypothetical protein